MQKLILRYLDVHNLYVGLTIVGTLAVASPSYAQVCEIQEAGHLRTVNYPSGKALSVEGHSHGITAEVMSLARLADDSKNNNEIYLLNAIQTVAALKETLEQYRENVATIKSLIEAGKLNFIALEYGDQIMEVMTKYSQIFLPMTRENLGTRGLKESQMIDDAFLIFAGPALYLMQKEPELMKNIKVVAVEDDELMQQSLDMESDGGSRLRLFAKKPGVTKEIGSVVNNLWARVILEYDLHRYLEDDWVFDELKSKVPVSLVEAAKAPIISALAAAQLLRRRDSKSSQKVLVQEGSGILLIGAAHARSMSNIFRNACLNSGK